MKNMEQKQAILDIRTNDASYSLPAGQINIDKISSEMGEDIAEINIEISQSAEEIVRTIENSARENSLTIIAPPIDFNITATYNDSTVKIERFNSFVGRMIAIPDGVDPSTVSTAVVLNSDGTFRHVPTKTVEVNGRYYAQIYSVTNSTYFVIGSKKTFEDVQAHWAKEEIDEMASRLVISGVSKEAFAPGRDITRAEFAAIMNRALGLGDAVYSDIFNDVDAGDWFAGAVSSIYSYGIIQGYEDGSYRPNEKITREEAMVMISRAMKIADTNLDVDPAHINSLLSSFIDHKDIMGWSEKAIAMTVQMGIVQGDHQQRLQPKENITRGQTTVMILRMLQKLELI
jgi:hypothetical protein